MQSEYGAQLRATFGSQVLAAVIPRTVAFEKAAFARLESSLDGGWDELKTEEKPRAEDKPQTEVKAETALNSNGHTMNEHSVNGYHPTSLSSASGVLFAPEPSSVAPSLSAEREATARRVIGRDLRQELREATKSFFDAAKAHDLKVGGQHQKTMLVALGEFLGVPIASRRTPTAQQSQGASAIATEDLYW